MPPKSTNGGFKARRHDLVVSDHAVLRYMERCMGFDIKAVRALLSERVSPIHKAGASGAWVDGAWAVIENGVLKTMLPARPTTYSRKLNAGEEL